MNDSYIYIITLLLPISALMLVLEVNPYHALVLRGILGAIAALIYTILGAADVALTEALVGTLLATMLCAVAVRSSLVFRLGVLVDQSKLSQENQLKSELVKNPQNRSDKETDEAIAVSENPLENPLEKSLDSPSENLVENLVESSVENLTKNLLENSQIPQETNATEPLSNFNLSNFDLLVSKLKVIFNKHHMQVELIPYAERGELDQALINKEVHAICVPWRSLSFGESTPDDVSYQTQVRLRRLYEIIKNELDDSGLALAHLTYVDPALDLSPNVSPNVSSNLSSNINSDFNSDYPFSDSATTPPNSGDEGETHL
jgi:putative multicomponent Na+:H+ antiporter subunit B